MVKHRSHPKAIYNAERNNSVMTEHCKNEAFIGLVIIVGLYCGKYRIITFSVVR